MNALANENNDFDFEYCKDKREFIFAKINLKIKVTK